MFLAAALAAPLAAAPRKLKPAIFSKHLHYLTGEDLARKTAELGFERVDLTVRRRGHVEPERVREDLPALAKLFGKHGVEIAMCTTDIQDAATPHAETILRIMSDLGVRYYRFGGQRYDPRRPVRAQLQELRPRLHALAAMNTRYKVCAMFHNHSGPNYVGGPIWDLNALFDGTDPAAMGFNYDVGHAVVEGGFGGWMASLNMTGDRLHGISVKDFVWEKSAKDVWAPAWKPTGTGMVPFPEFFKRVAQTGFSGPLQLHCEYPLGGADRGERELTIPRDEVYAAIRRDLERLKGWLSGAGLA